MTGRLISFGYEWQHAVCKSTSMLNLQYAKEKVKKEYTGCEEKRDSGNMTKRRRQGDGGG